MLLLFALRVMKDLNPCGGFWRERVRNCNFQSFVDVVKLRRQQAWDASLTVASLPPMEVSDLATATLASGQPINIEVDFLASITSLIPYLT